MSFRELEPGHQHAYTRGINPGNFGPLVFPLMKLYFTKHPFCGRSLLDTTPAEAKWVMQQTGIQLYNDYAFCSLDSVAVTPKECHKLLEQLRAMVDTIVAESPHPFDR